MWEVRVKEESEMQVSGLSNSLLLLSFSLLSFPLCSSYNGIYNVHSHPYLGFCLDLNLELTTYRNLS